MKNITSYPLPILQIEIVFLFIWNFLRKSSKRYLKSFIKMCISKVFQWDIKWCSFCKLNYLLFQCKKCIKEWNQMNSINCLNKRFYRTVGGSTYRDKVLKTLLISSFLLFTNLLSMMSFWFEMLVSSTLFRTKIPTLWISYLQKCIGTWIQWECTGENMQSSNSGVVEEKRHCSPVPQNLLI